MYMMPGDPIDMVVDRKVSEEVKQEMAHELGYDQPFMTQYVNWVDGVLHGDFGSWRWDCCAPSKKTVSSTGSPSIFPC